MTTIDTNEGVVPGHVAIIMDGNGRWATQRGLPRTAGHVEGARAATRAYRSAHELGIQQLTLYGFSTANFKRPAEEVGVIMQLFAEYARHQRDDFLARGIRFEVIGDMTQAPRATREDLEETIAVTADQPGMMLSLALAYGGQLDLLGAVRALSAEVRDGRLQADQIGQDDLRRHMWTRRLPDVDLLIRTGGEQRLSDFLLFENAYSEIYFDPVMWPDVEHRDLQRAVRWFARRQRRFGDVGPVEDAA